jgi:hypothetical protein
MSTQNSFNYLIYKRGNNNYIALESDGSQLLQDPVPERVIQTVLDQKGSTGEGPGHIYIRDGNYNLSAGFSGLNVSQHTRLTLEPTAYITVPNGYAGPVFRLVTNNTPNCYDNIIDGGTINETGPKPQRNWVCLLLQGTTEGVLFNKVMNMTIYDAGTGIKILVNDSRGWVNGNSFEFLKMWKNNIFIDFDITVPYPPDTESIPGIHRNNFNALECQCGDNTIQGIRNIRHVCNTFVNVKIWDLKRGRIAANVHKDGTGTIILSGIIAYPASFIDEGKSTKIIDQWNSKI